MTALDANRLQKKLSDAGIPDAQIDDFIDAVILLPLQLLAGTANIQKWDDLPADWVRGDTRRGFVVGGAFHA